MVVESLKIVTGRTVGRKILGFADELPLFYPLPTPTRKKLRQKHGMNENVPLDCISHCCFPHCAICQDYNEAKQRITSVYQPQIIMMQMPPQQQMQVVARS